MTSTSDEVGHTATPWEFKRHGEILGPDGRSICSVAFWAMRYEQGYANAAFIVNACNSHDSLVKALERLLGYVERNTCQHDETHRGGVLWEICDQCGAKWADDVGGKPKFKWHSDVTTARAALSQVKGGK